jgi:hypothetical protein
MSTYDTDLVNNFRVLSLNSVMVEINAATKYFDLLNARFPVRGTKINWQGISSKCKKMAVCSSHDSFYDFITNY